MVDISYDSKGCTDDDDDDFDILFCRMRLFKNMSLLSALLSLGKIFLFMAASISNLQCNHTGLQDLFLIVLKCA